MTNFDLLLAATTFLRGIGAGVIFGVAIDCPLAAVGVFHVPSARTSAER